MDMSFIVKVYRSLLTAQLYLILLLKTARVNKPTIFMSLFHFPTVCFTLLDKEPEYR